MGPATLGEGRISEGSSYPLHPSGKPAASLDGLSRRLRKHVCRGAPQGLVREASNV
jgi:hypothetical protein